MNERPARALLSLDAGLALTEALFASLLDDEPWVAFLNTAQNVFDAAFVTLILAPRSAEHPGLLLVPGGDPSFGRDYYYNLFANDPFTRLPEGKVVHFRDFVSPAARDRNPDYFDFLARSGGDEVLGLDLREAGGFELRLRLSRLGGQRPFDSADMAAVQSTVPHLKVAKRLFEQLAAGRVEQKIYSSAFEQMSLGVMVVDQSGRIRRMNPTAESIVQKNDGVGVHDNRIVVRDSAIARQLADYLGRAASSTEQLTLRVPRTSGRGDICIFAGGAAQERDVTGAGPSTVLFLSVPVEAPKVAPAVLRELLDLTNSEAAIAAAVADGLTLNDVAQRQGVSLNTVRAHLRSIFAKTGVKRQSQLVHLVHNSLPALGDIRR